MHRTAVWKEIAGVLATEIAGGRYRPGDKLPTEAALSARFGVNRHTVRHAIVWLAEAGTLHSRRGSGVFVTARPTDYALSRRVRFSENIQASGRTPSRRITRAETLPSTCRRRLLGRSRRTVPSSKPAARRFPSPPPSGS